MASVKPRSAVPTPPAPPEWAAAADACLKCNLCTAACPVVTADPDFAGPKRLGPDWYRRAAAGQVEAMAGVEDCTFCQLCEAACPVDIPVAHLIAWHKRRRRLPWRWRNRDRLLARPHWVARWPRLSSPPARLARWAGLAPQTERPRPQPWRRLPAVAPAAGRRRVGLYVDCYSYGFDGEVVEAAQYLLNVWGFAVKFVPAAPRCCGAAAYAGGYPEQAAAVARQCHAALRRALAAEPRPAEGGVEALVTLNATCDQTLRREWPRYLGLSVEVPVVSWVRFALQHAPAPFFAALSVAPAENVYLHTTCRAKSGADEGSLTALALKSGVAATPLALACCGAGGSYAFKVEHAAVAQRLAASAAEALRGQTAAIWVDSGTCALHLAQATGLPARHPAWWLARRYRQAQATQGREAMG